MTQTDYTIRFLTSVALVILSVSMGLSNWNQHEFRTNTTLTIDALRHARDVQEERITNLQQKVNDLSDRWPKMENGVMVFEVRNEAGFRRCLAEKMPRECRFIMGTTITFDDPVSSPPKSSNLQPCKDMLPPEYSQDKDWNEWRPCLKEKGKP